MTKFEEFKNMSLDELAAWIYENCYFDNSPWVKQFTEKYCDNCECIKGHYEDWPDREMEFSYCEIYNKCRFFPEMQQEPDCGDMVKMWLESEV